MSHSEIPVIEEATLDAWRHHNLLHSFSIIRYRHPRPAIPSPAPSHVRPVPTAAGNPKNGRLRMPTNAPAAPIFPQGVSGGASGVAGSFAGQNTGVQIAVFTGVGAGVGFGFPLFGASTFRDAQAIQLRMSLLLAI